MRKFLSTTCLLLLASVLLSQPGPAKNAYRYARQIVDTLASESMHGRGYVNNGDAIAAGYLRSQLKKLGVQPLGNDYYQSFNFPVNTFPGTIEFGFGAREEDVAFTGRPGKNFLVGASSPAFSLDLSVRVFDSTHCSRRGFKKFSSKLSPGDFILVDDRHVMDKNKLAYFKRVKANETRSPGIIELVNKLTWHQSQIVSDHVKIEILADSFRLRQKYFDQGRLMIQTKFIPDHPSQNVVGYVKGSVHPDSFIVFSAHYDHLGQMGKDVYFPGANDNASGCAMVLNLARHYSKKENRPECSVAFIFFAGEEVGLLGSEYFTKNPLFPLSRIKFLLNMDIMGTGEDGITVVNGTVFKKEFDLLSRINAKDSFIREVRIRGKSANSDHHHFTEKGVKAFFIYTLGGTKAYHDVYDRPETLPLNEFEDLFRLITAFIDEMLE